jgi:hypothetical protein
MAEAADSPCCTPFAAFWASGTASALDAGLIVAGQLVGSAAADTRVLDSPELNFQYAGEKITDQETGSKQNVLGQASVGDMAGKQLSPVVSINRLNLKFPFLTKDCRSVL